MTSNDALERSALVLMDRLLTRVVDAASGAAETTSEVTPANRFWLGMLATEESVRTSAFGDRAERMRPCAIGMRVRPANASPWEGEVTVRASAWWEATADDWRKSAPCAETIRFSVTSSSAFPVHFELAVLGRALAGEVGAEGHRIELRVELEAGRDGEPELVLQVVNVTAEEQEGLGDPTIYEVSMELTGLATRPFLLESLPDSFRYDRRVAAYGLNCGIEALDGCLRTVDAAVVDRLRPVFWVVDEPAPDLRFATLAVDPLPSLEELVRAHRAWGEREWSAGTLERRAREEGWTPGMCEEAMKGAGAFRAEAARMARGLQLMRDDPRLLRAFALANLAMRHAAHGKYDGWRPFQIGFQLAALASVLGGAEETDVVDVLWFATGGGKTETYLGLLVLAALFDRMRGKTHGITAWSRFPLRLLSLQQTQRFADAMAGAELIRRREDLGGDAFRVGFFMGDTNTPNRILKEPPPGRPDPYDGEMPKHYRVLLHCPFCRGALDMEFDHATWTLQHRCANEACPWTEDALPFHVVDDEIYRFLPTVIVGTLDKAAAIGFQAAMRGLVGPPAGLCPRPGHGHTYAVRRDTPTGCRVPDCEAKPLKLPQAGEAYRISFRLQDELHLLRDSLGAVDAHYESALDDITAELTGGRPKILASSATLSGYQHQCRALYGRESRVFPGPGPRAGNSFWSGESTRVMRRFVALAPRGVTLESAVDRLMTSLQAEVRRALADPNGFAAETGVDVGLVAQLVSLYGTDVVYANTIRDLSASMRSLETQVPVEGPLHSQELSGNTPFDEVRVALQRLEHPELRFEDRIHVVAASSMMSHGVDIDRLNRMVVLGHPLTTAEFIQATARIGRTWPGLVFVLHKMGRERDAGLFRSFPAFVGQGDRFVDAIPITRRSRRVLERTVSGLGMARLLTVAEPRIGTLTQGRLVARAVQDGLLAVDDEVAALVRALGLDAERDVRLCEVVKEHVEGFFRAVRQPNGASTYPSSLWARQPMMSLRDVEQKRPVTDQE